MTRVFGMNARELVWVAVGLELAVAEFWFLLLGEPLLTDAMRAGAARWLMWPVLFGVFPGHFFGERGAWAEGWGPWLLAGLGAVVVVRDLWFADRVPGPTQFQTFLLAAALGALLWGSR